MSPRPYNLGIRKAVAEESRRRVLDAAKQLLASGSAYEHFTVDTVAAHADVSRQTVYHQFHSKRGLLESMLDVMAQDAGLIEGIIKFRSQTDCLGALSVFTDTFCRFWGENRETISKLTAVAALHPELALALKERRKRRSENVEVLANMVAAGHGLGEFSSTKQIFQVIWSLTGFDTYCDLVDEGCSPNGAPQVMFDLCRGALGLPEPAS